MLRWPFVLFICMAPLACGSNNNGNNKSTPPPSSPPPTGSPAVEAAYNQELPAGQLAVQASTTFEQAVAGGMSDPVGATVTALQADSRVDHVDRLDGDQTLVVSLKSGVSFSLFVADKSRPEWHAQGGSTQAAAAAESPAPSDGPRSPGAGGRSAALPEATISCDKTTFPQSKTACVVPAYQSEFKQDLTSITMSLGRAGFNVVSLPMKTAADLVALQKALPTCGVLYISSHGGRMKNFDGHFGNHVTTEIELGLPDMDKFRENLAALVEAFGGDLTKFVGVTGHGKSAFWTLSPEFFASVTYPNTLVYVDACSSDKPIPPDVLAAGGTQLKDAFRQHGAGAFLGWSNPITTQISNPAADNIFNGLAPKVTNVDSVSLVVTPPNPTAGEAYVPSATISPAQAGVMVSLSVSGTDGFTRDETQVTDASGKVTFDAVPGGAGGVVDTDTISVGGADDSATALNVVQMDPVLMTAFLLQFVDEKASIADLDLDAATSFNLVCNNTKLTQTMTVVKF